MKLADSSHQRLEAFFREYLDDADFCLSEIDIYAGVFTKILTNLIGAHGITVGARIFIAPKFLTYNTNNFLKLPEDLIAHEITHVLQYRQEGLINFFYKYLSNYWQNLRRKEKWNALARQEAYFEIPFEVEACAIAERFVEWNSFQDRSKNVKGKTEQNN
jgi:hypothetical protein